MLCKNCGQEMVTGRHRHRRVRLCTACGRADYLDWATGLLKVLWWPRRFGKKVG